ncbi:MAG: sodium-dependent bicarbonate transport family permease [Thermoflexales bacterium]
MLSINADLIVANLLSPPILFFVLGVLAVAANSDLEIPQPIPRAVSLYLLLAIGFKGGFELRQSELAVAAPPLLAAMGMSAVVPLYAFPLLKRWLSRADAAAVAAAYGSVSVVTFATAAAFVDAAGLARSGFMVAALAVMESPAIVTATLLLRAGCAADQSERWGALLRESLFNGSVLLLVGSLVIGFVSGAEGGRALKPFTDDIFRGLLSLFLLDMGIVSARRFGDVRRLGARPASFGLLLPLMNAGLGLAVARVLSLAPGDAILFVVLCASASYIAVPAAMRLIAPEANPALYVTMSLAITFPFNIVVGIPLYAGLVLVLWR